MKRVVAVIAVVALCGLALGQGAPPAVPDGAVHITPKKGGWSVEELVKEVSAVTGKVIQYEANDPAVRGKMITFVGEMSIPREKLFRWLRSVLSQVRLVLVPVGPPEADLWSLMEVNNVVVSQHPEYVAESDLDSYRDADGVYVTTTLSVKYMTDLPRARNALQQMSTRPNGKINDIPGSRGFVVCDFAPVVWAQAQLLKKLDLAAKSVPPPPPPPARHTMSRREILEGRLGGARTALAAQYFLMEIRRLPAESAGK